MWLAFAENSDKEAECDLLANQGNKYISTEVLNMCACIEFIM